MQKINKGFIPCLLVALCCFVSKKSTAHGPVHENIKRLTKIIESHPDSADLYLQRGQYYQIDEDFDKAFTDYAKANALAPNMHIIDLHFAKLFSQHNYPNAGLQYINRFLAFAPNNLDGLMARAAIHTQMSNDSLAFLDFEAAITQAKTPVPDYYMEISKAVLAADSTNFDQAIAWLKRGEETLGFNIALSAHSVELDILQEKYDQAITSVDNILTNLQRKEKWLLKKASIYELAQRPKEAYATYQQTIQSIKRLPRRIRGKRSVTELQAKAELKIIELESIR